MNQFAAAFGGIQDARKEQPHTEARVDSVVTKRKPAHKPARAQATQALAKSRNPEYEPVKLFMHTEKRRKAERRWEDEGGRDLSSLIEILLNKYLSS